MRFKYKILLIVTPLVFILDQLTKWIIRSNLRLGEQISVIPGYFDIVHVTNKGAAFGLFAGSTASFRTPFFFGVSIAAVVIIIITLVKLSEREKLLSVIFSLILGGIAGNVLDRMMFGEVTDFLSVHIKDKVADFILLSHHFNSRLEWPAFNIADSAISVAMVLLVLTLLRPADKEKGGG